MSDSKKTPDSDQNLPDDDRNLVATEPSATDVPPEEKLWLFWQAHQQKVWLLVFVVLAGVAISQWMEYQKNRRIQATQAEYVKAGEQDRLEFAQNNKDTTLGGFAYLQLADQKYKEEAYSEAADLYKQAQNALSGTPLDGRPQIGYSLSKIQAEEEAAATTMLHEVLSSSTISESIRAEAAYQLALLACKDKQYKQADSLLTQIEDYQYAGIWAAKARQLRESVSELQSLDTTTSES